MRYINVIRNLGISDNLDSTLAPLPVDVPPPPAQSNPVITPIGVDAQCIHDIQTTLFVRGGLPKSSVTGNWNDATYQALDVFYGSRDAWSNDNICTIRDNLRLGNSPITVFPSSAAPINITAKIPKSVSPPQPQLNPPGNFPYEYVGLAAAAAVILWVLMDKRIPAAPALRPVAA